MPRAGRTAFLTLNPKRLRACLPLDNDLQTLPAQQSLGALSVLPNEILHEILADLDIPTLTALRRVNRRARTTIDGIPSYASLVRSHSDALRAVVASKAVAYTCRELHAELQNTQCRKCGAEATHLYLISCHLVCRSCFTGSWLRDVPPSSLLPQARAKYGATYPYPCLHVAHFCDPVRGLHREFQDYVPLSEEHVLEHCKVITHKDLRQVPHILSLPVRYQEGDKEQAAEPRVKLYDIRALLNMHTLENCYCMRNFPDVMRRYQAVIALRETGEEEKGEIPMGWVHDPFEPSYRAMHMN
ncbi:hypothetical protein B0T25DRAFT_543075 [Lasiosphaeria hispida]|uniref:F-box domain-containing protein n=1 Tax=Lasiosphaeria hispida TaxID=260671 RepID=A0AAJ0ME81_9PEZI|nr:hypothetical protein B0T25DRAFT_543075 [Lasiosphaeria hispida]